MKTDLVYKPHGLGNSITATENGPSHTGSQTLSLQGVELATGVILLTQT